MENSKQKITDAEKIYEMLTPKLADSMGVKILFKPDMTEEDLKNLHYDGVWFDGKDLRVANHDGYVLTVTGLGETVDDAGDKVDKLLRKIIIPKGFWRNDFHDTNYHHAREDLLKWGYLTSDSINLDEMKTFKNADTIKDNLRKIIYEQKN